MNATEGTNKNQQEPLSFTANDRVRRIPGVGPFGIVEAVREETNTSATDRPRAKKYLIKVRWDSGTVSYFAPEALQIEA